MGGQEDDADEECEINFDDPEAILNCKAQLAKRRQKIAFMLLRKQLFQVGGLWAFTKIFVALIWAFANGLFLGLIRKIFSKKKKKKNAAAAAVEEEEEQNYRDGENSEEEIGSMTIATA